ncbi:MAG: hypothetical protein ACXWAY_13865, partial [Acidimicrobiia bacterium]
LEAAGHRVARCHEPGSRAFPCAGLDPGRCPLEEDPIDVVLTVRPRTHPRPSPLEDGVTCALRRHVPVVVAGRTALNPFAQYSATFAGTDDVVAACERAATGPQLDHEAVATRMLCQTLSRADLPSENARAGVRRSGKGLRVTLYMPAGTSSKQRDVASVRVVGALRAFDPHAPNIEVGYEELP